MVPIFRASPSMLSMWPLQEYLSHPRLVIYFLAIPPIKLKLVQQIGGGTTNSKPPGPIIMMAQSQTSSTSQIIFITLFSAGAQSCCAFYQLPQTLQQLCWAKTHFPEPNRHLFWHFFIQLYWAGSHTGHHWRCSLGHHNNTFFCWAKEFFFEYPFSW
jgi:hypothetical protein